MRASGMSTLVRSMPCRALAANESVAYSAAAVGSSLARAVRKRPVTPSTSASVRRSRLVFSSRPSVSTAVRRAQRLSASRPSSSRSRPVLCDRSMRACPSTSLAFGAPGRTLPKNSSAICVRQASGSCRSGSASVSSVASSAAVRSSRCQPRTISRTASSSSICSVTVRVTSARPRPRFIVISSTFQSPDPLGRLRSYTSVCGGVPIVAVTR